jgi:ketosteroid isomerase-like protein
MKRLHLTCASLIVLVLGFSTFAQAQAAKEHEAIRLEKERTEALVKGDLEVYLRYLSDDFFSTSQSADLRTKASVAQMLKGRTYERYDLDDLKVRDRGDVAVVTGRFSRKGAFPMRDGKTRSFEEQGRFTSVWVRQNGRWTLDVYHQSVTPKAAQ